MLRKLKLAGLAGASRTGLTTLVGESGWRRNRLLILCYHGISLRDEHVWEPGLYIEQALLERRMEHLRKARCNVLPLAEAIERLYRGDLPKRSVAVTFDDGWHDFYRLAYPVLKKLEIPTTVYLTTYYSNFNRPVFDTTVQYMLWKREGQTFCLPPIVREPILLSGTGARAAMDAIRDYARRERLTGKQKDELQAQVAEHLGIDFAELLREKFMHLMTPEEVREVAAGGIDVQLHTHRHRVSTRQERFAREIEDNRAQIEAMIGTRATHFCYPSGAFLPQFETWLAELGVGSATTCVSGLCTAKSNRYFLPRLLDAANLPHEEFDAWVHGLRDLLPKRSYPLAEGLIRDD